MASRYHWLAASFDGSWSGLSTLPYSNITIPAGATLKRFIISNCNVTGVIASSNGSLLQPVVCNQTVEMYTGPYAGHILWSSSKRVPTNHLSTMVTELGIGYRIYTQIMCAGDEELGVNEKCSYGKIGGGAMVVRYTQQIQPDGSAPSLLSGKGRFQFRCLYYL